MRELPIFYDVLDLTFKEIIGLLKRGVKDRKSCFHYTTLCTVDEKSCPRSRTVILRSFDEEKFLVKIHSDSRANKIKEIEMNRNVSLNFYDDKKKIQIRIKGSAEIKKSYKKSWDNLSNWSKRCYLTEKKPGSYGDKPSSGFSERYSKDSPSDEESKKGINNFCVILIEVQNIEWLYLASQGHRRAIFEIKRGEKLSVKSSWMIP